MKYVLTDYNLRGFNAPREPHWQRVFYNGFSLPAALVYSDIHGWQLPSYPISNDTMAGGERMADCLENMANALRAGATVKRGGIMFDDELSISGSMELNCPDAHFRDSDTLKKVIAEMRQRERIGVKKYGTTVDRTDLTHKDWVQHTREEMMDMLLYITRLGGLLP